MLKIGLEGKKLKSIKISGIVAINRLSAKRVTVFIMRCLIAVIRVYCHEPHVQIGVWPEEISNNLALWTIKKAL